MNHILRPQDFIYKSMVGTDIVCPVSPSSKRFGLPEEGGLPSARQIEHGTIQAKADKKQTLSKG
jgi:hypothetical protein